MRRGLAGYTVVEVILVVSVSAVLLLAALRLFAGQQGSTQFTQSMQDLRSKIQSLVVEVTSGDFPPTTGYTCTINASGRPVFNAGGSGDSQACIFLGKALMVRPGTDNMHIFPIAANRNHVSSGKPATSFDQVNPEPVIDGSSNYLFTETYVLGSGRVSSATIDNPPGSFDVIAFYNSLANDRALAGDSSQKLLNKAYQNLSGANLNPPPSTDLKNCIEAQPPCGLIVRDFETWILCVSDDSRSAKLIVDSTPSGIKTRLDYSTCT